ncbi:diguanylate cyclase (GGDEF)-like protein [Catenuloplanes nepalensis]|uniref:Diguanylate cyclase (GGDEF)-like protein n=1 Tax=Catenuloplanes nepalensis TaxID=587533 RepID=A0ABT9MMK5_9ACTN|nr:diguanylate cyclase [Catenuloplanes nepalensis]MDP9792642.1 diguanylate cyclase (GGDEF)-like protein [Catenuloplanes nepalensis]
MARPVLVSLNIGAGPPIGSSMSDGVVYDSVRTSIVRDAGEPGVLIKAPRGPHGARRIVHERAVLARLAGVQGVQQLAPADGCEDRLALIDYDAPTLAESCAQRPMDSDELLRFAIGLAETVTGMHARGVVHRDLNPARILADGEPRRPILIDFGLATTVAEERPEFTHHSEIEGTLPYLAPELTGRTGWPVDQRADLYALGATLYELASGAPPFGRDGDTLDLIRQHLSATPAPLTGVPAQFAAVVARLLEKEPGRRYQSAGGLLHDLRRLAAEPDAEFPPGEHDFPARLVPPARLVGRDDELETLRRAFRDAVAGRTRCLLVSGSPGVGKSSLIDQLRPTVTDAGGWFVSARFDALRRGADVSPVRLAVATIARMLLAEPEEELIEARWRLRDALGIEAGLLAEIVPDFRTVLGIPAGESPGHPPLAGATTEPADPRTATARLARVGLKLLQVVARPDRPVVLVLDDIQWAGPAPLGLIDEVVGADDLTGLLLVGTYRDAELDAAHPLTALLQRWQRMPDPPVRMELANLGDADVGGLLAELLRLPAVDAAGLAAAVAERTGGNPFDTVVLVNALRREGVLTPGPDGWRWDPDALRRHIGDGDVLGLLGARIAALPDATAELVADLACLGGHLSGPVLAALTGGEPETVLGPALTDGLLVAEGADGVRFRHDRVRQAAYTGPEPEERRARHLRLARRLADRPGCGGAAAEQYQLAAADVTDPAERRRAVELLVAAAGQARLISNFAATEKLLSAAATLLPDPGGDLRLAIDTERHAALVGLARLDEADAAYRAITAVAAPLRLAPATTLQVGSLLMRGRAEEGCALGLGVLAALGHPVPDVPADAVDDGADLVSAWVAAPDDLPENTDPGTAAAGMLINQLLLCAYMGRPGLVPWLVSEAVRLRVRGGPCRELTGPMAHVMFLTVLARDDYRTGYLAALQVLTESESRGYEPATSQARYLCAMSALPWFEPLEETLRQLRRAREGMLAAGDQGNACIAYWVSVPVMMDCGGTLDDLAAEVDQGLALAARTGNDLISGGLAGWREMVRVLRGAEPTVRFSRDENLARVRDVPIAAAYLIFTEALVAAISGDDDALDRTSVEDAMCVGVATPLSLTGCFLRCLALAARLRRPGALHRADLLAELDRNRLWLAARAAQGPANIAHLHLCVEAERAAVDGDFDGAIRFYDEALQLAGRRRPWHRALIAERAGRYHLAEGLRFAGERLIMDAFRWYGEWGAAGVCARLAAEFPFLRHAARPSTGSTTITSDAVDLPAVLRASQALSSTTRVGRLQEQVAEVLAALTGATGVRLVLRDVEAGGWFLLGADEDVIPLAEAAGQLPLTAIRYAERTGVPLLIGDTSEDDRFRGDAYLRSVPACSLLIVPILSRGEPRGLLVLESRHGRDAFAVTGIDAVQLIAGQLSVSLDNALLYASLERKVAERTEALRAANEQLELLAVTDPLTGLANRRRLAEVLEESWRRAVRPGLSLAVALIDIDRFKLYNDYYGHPAGDECLSEVARTLLRAVRDTDTVARFGGEEFAAVLPGADLPTAVAVAERMRSAVEALDHRHELSDHGIVTVSVGVAAVIPDRIGRHESLVKLADESLYAAKAAGRNRVVAHDP